MKESKEFYIAHYASGSSAYLVDDYYHLVKDKTFNLQLRYWVEALCKFENLYPGNFKTEELVLILNLLCSSLETLAGVNVTPENNDRTPSLRELYSETLKKQKGWNLGSEKPGLIEALKEMINYHNKVCKHLNRSSSRKELIKSIDYNKIQRYMKTTQDIWLWILEKQFKGKRLDEQSEFFDNDFTQEENV